MAYRTPSRKQQTARKRRARAIFDFDTRQSEARITKRGKKSSGSDEEKRKAERAMIDKFIKERGVTVCAPAAAQNALYLGKRSESIRSLGKS